MDISHVFPKFVITTNTLLLWEKETINREEVKFMLGITEKEDLEKLPSPLQQPKKNLRSNQKAKRPKSISPVFFMTN